MTSSEDKGEPPRDEEADVDFDEGVPVVDHPKEGWKDSDSVVQSPLTKGRGSKRRSVDAGDIQSTEESQQHHKNKMQNDRPRHHETSHGTDAAHKSAPTSLTGASAERLSCLSDD